MKLTPKEIQILAQHYEVLRLPLHEIFGMEGKETLIVRDGDVGFELAALNEETFSVCLAGGKPCELPIAHIAKNPEGLKQFLPLS